MGETTATELGAALRTVTQAWPRSIVCGNSHAQCGTCNMDAHAPCPCGDWGRWQNKIGIAMRTAASTSEATNGQRAEVANALWVAANTKKCPKCSLPIEKDDGCNHMVCSRCKHEFCWICMQEWGLHNNETGGYFQCNRFVESTTAGGGDGGGSSDDSDEEELSEGGGILRNANDVAYQARVRNNMMARFIHHFSRYSAHSESGEKERRLKQVAIRRLQNTLLYSSEQSHRQGFRPETEAKADAATVPLVVVNIISPHSANTGLQASVDRYSTPPRQRKDGQGQTPSSAGSASRRPSLLHSLSSAFGGSASSSASKTKTPSHKGTPSTASAAVGARDTDDSSKTRYQGRRFTPHVAIPPGNDDDHFPFSAAELVIVCSSTSKDLCYCPVSNETTTVQSKSALPWLQGENESNPLDHVLRNATANPPSVEAVRSGGDEMPIFHLDLQAHPSVAFLIHAFDELYACRQLLRGSYAYAFYAFKNLSEANSMHSRFLTPPNNRSTHMHHFYPSVAYRGGGSGFRVEHQEIGRYKEVFERLQAELEMTTEILSDVVARARLRATKTHIIAATSRASLKRREFEASIFTYWEHVAFRTVSQSLGDPAGENNKVRNEYSRGVPRTIRDRDRDRARDRDRERTRNAQRLRRTMGVTAEDILGVGDIYHRANWVGHIELDRNDPTDRALIATYDRVRRGVVNHEELYRLSMRERQLLNMRDYEMRSRAGGGGGDLSPPSQGGSADDLLRHMRGNGSNSDSDPEIFDISSHIMGRTTRIRRAEVPAAAAATEAMGRDNDDDDDDEFDIAAAIGWIEQLTLSQAGGRNSGTATAAAATATAAAGRRGSSSGRSAIRPRSSVTDLDFSVLLSPDRGSAGDGNAEAGTSSDDAAAAAAARDAAVAVYGEDVSESAAAATTTTTPVAAAAAATAAATAAAAEETSDSAVDTNILSHLSSAERERLAMVVSTRRARAVEADEFASNSRLLAALSTSEQGRLVAMLQESGRLSDNRPGSEGAPTASISSGSTNAGRSGQRVRERDQNRDRYRDRARERGRERDPRGERRRMGDSVTVSTEGSTAGSPLRIGERPERPRLARLNDTLNGVDSSARYSDDDNSRNLAAVVDANRSDHSQRERARRRAEAQANDERMLRLALRIEEQQEMERAILMSLQDGGSGSAAAGGTAGTTAAAATAIEGMGGNVAAGSGPEGVATSAVNEENLRLLISMGFGHEQSAAALVRFNNDVEQATEHLCSGL